MMRPLAMMMVGRPLMAARSLVLYIVMNDTVYDAPKRANSPTTPLTKGVPVPAMGMAATSASKMMVTSSYGCRVDTWRLPRMRRKKSTVVRSEEHTSELQSRENLVCRLLLEKKKNTI